MPFQSRSVKILKNFNRRTAQFISATKGKAVTNRVRTTFPLNPPKAWHNEREKEIFFLADQINPRVCLCYIFNSFVISLPLFESQT